MRKKPKWLDQRITAHSRLFSLEEIALQFSNDEKRIYERIIGRSKRGAVLIVPMLDEHTFLLVREYCVGTDRYELGFPKGLIDEGEMPLEAANRELMEEVGMAANKMEHLKSMTLAPGYFGASIYTILAEDLYPKKLQGDEPEEIEVVEWRLDNIEQLMARDEFSESRSIAALFLVREIIQSRG